jgi:hypothetical protein
MSFFLAFFFRKGEYFERTFFTFWQNLKQVKTLPAPIISFPSHSHTFVYLEEECTYHSTLVSLVLIMLFSEMLKFSKNIFLKEQNSVKESIESSKIFEKFKFN